MAARSKLVFMLCLNCNFFLTDKEIDLFPVQLSGEQDMRPLTRQETWESKPSAVSSPASSSSPTSSSVSTVTPNRRTSTYQKPSTSGLQRKGTELWPKQHAKAQQSTEQAVKVPKRENTGAQGSSIFAIGVDVTYKLGPSPPIRPGESISFFRQYSADHISAACFYVRSKYTTKDYYQAIYLILS